jgi:hypothetical protein
MPHASDTGGFFAALLRKVRPLGRPALSAPVERSGACGRRGGLSIISGTTADELGAGAEVRQQLYCRSQSAPAVVLLNREAALCVGAGSRFHVVSAGATLAKRRRPKASQVEAARKEAAFRLTAAGEQVLRGERGKSANVDCLRARGA